MTANNKNKTSQLQPANMNLFATHTIHIISSNVLHRLGKFVGLYINEDHICILINKTLSKRQETNSTIK